LDIDYFLFRFVFFDFLLRRCFLRFELPPYPGFKSLFSSFITSAWAIGGGVVGFAIAVIGDANIDDDLFSGSFVNIPEGNMEVADMDGDVIPETVVCVESINVKYAKVNDVTPIKPYATTGIDSVE
jgi:hypothetical protein